MLLVCQVGRLGKLEDELKQLVPLLVWNQNFSELANDVGDVLLDDCDGLLLEASQQKILGLLLIVGWELQPQVSNDLTQVNARHLPHVLIGGRGHEDEKVFERLNALEVLLEHSRRLFDDFGVRAEQAR